MATSVPCWILGDEDHAAEGPDAFGLEIGRASGTIFGDWARWWPSGGGRSVTEEIHPRIEHPRPKVSVGLPVYNGERYLARALDSLIGQTFRDIEIIICDNASSDGTRDICLRYARNDPRIHYHRNDTNIGVARNFNRAFQLAVGEYFKWAACDDWCDPMFLERCVAVLDADSEAVLCHTGAVFVDAAATPLGDAPSEDLGSPSPLRRGHRWLRKKLPVIPAIYGLMRADALRRTHLMWTGVTGDRILMTELILLGPLRRLQEPLMFCFVNDRTFSTARRPSDVGRLRPRLVPLRQVTWWDPENVHKLPTWRWRFLGNLLWAVLGSNCPMHVRLILGVEVIARYVRAHHRRLLSEVWVFLSVGWLGPRSSVPPVAPEVIGRIAAPPSAIPGDERARTHERAVMSEQNRPRVVGSGTEVGSN